MRKNNFARGCLVAWLAMSAALAGGAGMYAQPAGTSAPPLRWDVISVKPMSAEKCGNGGGIGRLPDGISAACVPVAFVIQDAFHVMDPGRIAGLPEWTTDMSKLFSIEARVSGGDAGAYKKLAPEQKVGMLQQVLVERFHLSWHTETRELAAYDLVMSKGGAKLKAATPEDSGASQFGSPDGHVKWSGAPLTNLKSLLGRETGRPVVDKTGLTGKYDFTLEFTPAAHATTDTTGRPSVFTALEEQLGLKLIPAKEPVDVLVIDSIEQPAAN